MGKRLATFESQRFADFLDDGFELVGFGQLTWADRSLRAVGGKAVQKPLVGQQVLAQVSKFGGIIVRAGKTVEQLHMLVERFRFRAGVGEDDAIHFQGRHYFLAVIHEVKGGRLNSTTDLEDVIFSHNFSGLGLAWAMMPSTMLGLWRSSRARLSKCSPLDELQ